MEAQLVASHFQNCQLGIWPRLTPKNWKFRLGRVVLASSGMASWICAANSVRWGAADSWS